MGGCGGAINLKPWSAVSKIFFREAAKELENQRWKVKFCHELKTSQESLQRDRINYKFLKWKKVNSRMLQGPQLEPTFGVLFRVWEDESSASKICLWYALFGFGTVWELWWIPDGSNKATINVWKQYNCKGNANRESLRYGFLEEK